MIWGINDMNVAWADGVKGIESAAQRQIAKTGID